MDSSRENEVTGNKPTLMLKITSKHRNKSKQKGLKRLRFLTHMS